MQQHRPIGYWLRLLDQLIEEHLNRVLAAEALHRRHWQTMNLLRAAPAAQDTIAETLRPFWSASSVGVDEVLDELVRRAWITSRQPYGLTPAGEAAHTTLARIVERAARQINEGVGAKQYDDTVEVLRHMVKNTENLRRSAPSRRATEPGRPQPGAQF
ncbi:MarR family transcriptional regulator [Nonomuraea diastatica]|uniref:MarR family transcriptional regulator n=1 Tax=Nonomuraea diastatica TaxID=1848329 RepID=A0A4V2YDE0_9ACTN|nr:MarR family transcriptional regulator [Nonomuraea diastatica]TDD14996.1 MarR family transcriptional regulator [Nonomuraea diastatica]